jgi:cyanophycinase
MEDLMRTRPGISALIALSLAFGSTTVYGQQATQDGAETTEYGPARGTLVIVGGGNLNGTGIFERFIELGGGPDGKFVIVPTAGGNRDGSGAVRAYDEERVTASWKARGLKNVTMLHTHDPAVANTEEFVKNLREATAVWFDGGRQWNIVDSYAGTLTYREFHNVLARGGVIGGTSAGATIQGDYLVRGDVQSNTLVMTDEPEHEQGFEFVRNVDIDQHINARNRWDDLIQVIERFPDHLGIGLSEGTAIIVTGDTFETMGKWKVAVHDNHRVYDPWLKPYYVLDPGTVYDMKARRVVHSGDGTNRRPGTAAGRGAGAGGAP